MTVKYFFRTVACLTLVVSTAVSFAQEKNPKDIMDVIVAHRTQRMDEARSAGQRVDMAAINAETKAMALKAAKGVDPANVDLDLALSWASVFSFAGMHQEICDLCLRFLKSNPSREDKSTAQAMVMRACNTLGDADMLVEILATYAPATTFESQGHLGSVVRFYADTIAEKMGIEAALKAIDDAMALAKFEDPEEYAKRSFDSFKARGTRNRDGSEMTDEQITAMLVNSAKSRRVRLIYSAANKKSGLLEDAGRKDEALSVLKEFVKDRDPSDASVRRANSAIKQTEMIGSPATALNFGRQYGDFESLDAWKGKVVIIDFTAHW